MTKSENPIRRAAAGLLAAAMLAIGLAACSGVQPYDFVAIDEIPPGPGLFSGADGEFVLYSR